ncbi:pilus assembly protein [Acinetobacter sp. YH01005]|uniref:pilus assembly protein n=1 Tax=Acinetobacter sp. YH01005 TaxID=2601021 RepID=UPI00211EB261|nr:PilC/PilY family type IV pilus protein [Acinetobacter sp. YH01005]
MRLKPLVIMMALLPVMAVPTSTAVLASDLSLYRGNTTGKTSILLMLDTSGSMGISSLVLPNNNTLGSPGDVDPQYANTATPMCDRVNVDEGGVFKQWAYNALDKRVGSDTYNKTSFKKTVNINGRVISYYLRGCGNPSIDSAGKLIESSTGKFDRLSRLKDALIQLLADSSIPNTTYMGLGHFSAKTPLTVGTTTNKLVDGHSGRILVPNAQLNAAQREKLILQLVSLKSVDTTTNEDGTANANLKLSSTAYPDIFKASSGTPTAHAYAEAAAYMMGTTTGQDSSLPSTSTILYDGYSVMQKSDDATKQVYYVCVALGTERPTALGATVMACDNEWNKSESDWYDATNKRMGSTIKIYKPNGSGGWLQVTPIELKNTQDVGDMNSLWETHAKLPVGWRYGGWMKLAHEPMDIEPIGGKVWANKGANNLVSYRTSPFSIKTGTITNTITTEGFQDCPSGFNILSGWTSLCVRSGDWERAATQDEIDNKRCEIPVIGENPILNARNPQGAFHYETYNMNDNRTYYDKKKCKQKQYAVIRPWGGITQTVSTSGPIDNNYGGFAYSASDTKNGSVYKTGGSTSSCDGNGIYFLTDGSPNSTKDSMAQTIMNTSLNNDDSYKFSAKPSGTGVLVSPNLNSGLFAGETGGWEYIGEYAKKLRNRTDLSNTQKNPADMNIKTAVVGFGASFAGLTKNTDGTYNCASAPNNDAKNACLWGSKAYGDGGFYYAENSEDIKNSIIKFVSDVTVGFTPSSLGSISVPRDPLDQTKSMTEGFFPMIMPMEDSTFRTWAGNLKKYKILGGTLKDSSNNAIYKVENNQQVINSSAKDLWSTAASGSDHSLINSGGAWNKIPVPSTALAEADSISNVDSERKVYILDGSSLKKVTKTNLATNTTGTDALSGTYTINQRLALLNYMGYQTAFPAAATQTTLTSTEINTLAVNPASPYRFLGGVVHSTPLMVTKESTVTSSNVADTRKEYTVYGSMDGGLHIVDASTGKEQSVFVPPEIITNQYDTLAGKDSKGVGSLSGIAYGVDAPWVADNTFKVQITKSGTVSTTKYVANKMNIYGGLRMGGSGLYGLDILNPASPKLLFQIKPTSTNEFQRMAQIWAKPTIAEIRVKGERKKVLIFGGGYDADVYEKPAATFTEPSSTYGNALYIVDAANGNLIWMSSSNGSGISDSYKKTINSDINYSVVGQPVVRDYDADGLADMIYFADLGGQIFRVDLNNNNQMSATDNTNIAVRVQTIAKLKDGTFVPRFYDRLSTAVFDDGQNRFVLVTAGSGNRSFPLEAEVGGKNKIYGLIDRDAAANGLENSSFTSAATILPANLANSGILGKTVSKQISAADIANMKLTTGNTMLRGWSFELRSVDSGNYARAFEDSQLITGDLYVSLYDPKATLTGTVSGCGGGVTGISTTHRICMPYGDCAAYVKTSYQGINGPAFGAVSSTDPRTTMLVGPIAETQESCVGNCKPANTTLTDQNLYKYSQARKIKPVRWFEW